MDQQRPLSQKFPAGLAGVLNSPEEHRDSAYFSSTDASSKRAISRNLLMASREPIGLLKNVLQTPQLRQQWQHERWASNGFADVTKGARTLVAFDRTQSLDSAPNSAGFATGDVPEALSRRESVDSRINQGFNDMRLGNSPYASHNPRTTSVPRKVIPKTMRIAPAITGPATGHIARAAEPTKGQAWAFPEEDSQRVPPATNGANGSLAGSRRSSLAESFASSQYTTESRLPPGQRRLEETVNPYQRLSNASGEYSTVHHHSLQHKQLDDLRNEEAAAHAGAQPYSRTPELRVSHKLAERKRRTEMKELFDQLRDLMPQERGSKASKWEILTKAERDRPAAAGSRTDARGAAVAARWQIHTPKTSTVGHARPELPPLRSLQSPTGPPQGPESMTGVQYEPPRVNGYRPAEPTRF
ncbi:hypothetical protein CHGG_05891 [Chaetomium globosum CBS 148.51]|uniref:BHLH domain-containing protein n=1 Tax=Chaetomium globosum (strain ATCC 6205 / CBS 148.51 / DSM 1962 / NBRC 6347 / NRRL 1970) TaxID=306901 RepID=Q2H624_CHAGB|nr:uncharacterized protein CHGG_05891 [Chaetomium globosum CBS 148.51]EAQ89272.1 hypothetical protein CHGG_05891 [Chaetomium globosum CBS 148.51]